MPPPKASKSPAMNGLRSAMSVDVTAPLPPQQAPWPANTEEILMGTPTRPPTGFVADPVGTPGSMPKSYQGEYDRFAGLAPQLAKRAGPMYDLGDPIGILKGLVGRGSYVPALDATVFREKPTPELMGHETIHRMQMQNFPTRAQGTKAWTPRRSGELAYLDAPGEQQAYKVEELLRQKREKSQTRGR
jgi:hypothetical protein